MPYLVGGIQCVGPLGRDSRGVAQTVSDAGALGVGVGVDVSCAGVRGAPRAVFHGVLHHVAVELHRDGQRRDVGRGGRRELKSCAPWCARAATQ